ncbi:Dfp1/Him1, central region-domain-containing protein [Lentinula raphanica]|nr:Dfp1/Him1, central region-domain-containing protein [Lentinula raphanica]
MATTARNPLSQHSHLSLASPHLPKMSTLKRPRSPGIAPGNQPSNGATKRVKAAPESSLDKQQKRTKKEEKREEKREETEWREKYRRAFGGFRFHFSEDIQNTDYVKQLEKRILQLGGTIEDFFSSSITHLVVKDVVDPSKASDKENRNGRKSPKKPGVYLIVSLSSVLDVPQVYHRAIDDAKSKIKEWGVRKLDNVLSRCLQVSTILPTSGPLPPRLNPSTSISQSKSLNKLLETEKIHGTTERDPTQKRRDFTYFAKGSYFVLVEDIHKNLATIVAHQYLPPKKGSTRTPWPVLHCHPQSRGPFVPFDEREKKRWEKAQKLEKEEKLEAHRREIKEQKLFQERISREREALHRGFDLRRSVSMNNLRRRESLEAEAANEQYLDMGDPDSACASGYLASGNGAYMAASGNSVTVTSTTGTTSTTTGGSNFGLGSKLSAKLQAFADQQVPTSLKGRRDSIKGDMGPPAVPEGRVGVGLRKAKSTNNLKLPKREEGSKPGYCESCRQKFEDFKQHVRGSRHRRFAKEDAHFAELDIVLATVKRKTVDEIAQERNIRPVHNDDMDEDPFIDNSRPMFPDVDLDDI